MTCEVFHRSALLDALGVEHGLGTVRSAHVRVPGLVRARQVHGVALVRAPGVGGQDEADALWTQDEGTAVGVVTADCVPILLAHRGHGAVAAVHAGWRGSAAAIAERTVRAVAGAIGADPSEFVAAIGPHIGASVYEVDERVREIIGVESVFSPSMRKGHYLLDLFELNRIQLVRAGVPSAAIERVGGCTFLDPGRYASYRRDGTGGRMLHWIRMPG